MVVPVSRRKRRIRLQIMRIPNSNVLAIVLKNHAPIAPINWAEDLADHIRSAIESHNRKDTTRNSVTIPVIRTHDGINEPFNTVLVTLPRTGWSQAIVHEIIDQTVEWWDVWVWPQVEARDMLRGGQKYVRVKFFSVTDPSLNHFSNPDQRPVSLNPQLLGRVRTHGLVKEHIVPYTARWRNIKTYGLRTICPEGSTCSCKALLPSIWHQAWSV